MNGRLVKQEETGAYKAQHQDQGKGLQHLVSSFRLEFRNDQVLS